MGQRLELQTIQVVVDRKLLQAADRVALRVKQNRSALIRDALRQHLKALEVKHREKCDRDGYLRTSQNPNEVREWEMEAQWPEP